MSTNDQSLQAHVDAALATWLAAHGGGMVSSFHVVVDFVDSDGEQAWGYGTSPDQKLITTMGLLTWSTGVAEYEMRRHLEERYP